MFVIIQLYYTKQCHNVKNKKSVHDDRVGVSDVNSFFIWSYKQNYGESMPWR